MVFEPTGPGAWAVNEIRKRAGLSSHEALDANYTVGFKEGKHEFFPYPTSVMDKNPNLVQNPGWE